MFLSAEKKNFHQKLNEVIEDIEPGMLFNVFFEAPYGKELPREKAVGIIDIIEEHNKPNDSVVYIEQLTFGSHGTTPVLSLCKRCKLSEVITRPPDPDADALISIYIDEDMWSRIDTMLCIVGLPEALIRMAMRRK